MTPEPFDDLRASMRATREAAERIAAHVPAQGWASEAEGSLAAAEIEALLGALRGLRDLVPEDLWEEIRELLRLLVLVLRAVLDAIARRLEASAEPDPDAPERGAVQDIPNT
jgi:hypothetical protein